MPGCVASVLALATPRSVGALIIYRIGGANLDAPEQCGDENVTCHFLEWDDVVDAEKFGSAHLLAPTPDFLQPEQLDPSVNLTPLIRERGGSIRANDPTGNWVKHPDLDPMFDGDYETAYTGLGLWFQQAGVGYSSPALGPRRACRMTIREDTSAGETPEIREAWPKVRGLTAESF